MTALDRASLRIIDANLNRAREALRVMEEHARFVLGDAGLCSSIKEVRHLLAESVPGALSQTLIAHRDIEGDVGCAVTTPTEFNRSGTGAVATAAGRRLSEALRAVEEYGKTIDLTFAAKIERLRYRGYELERRLSFIAAARERFGRVRLYLLLTEALCHTDWFRTAQAALAAGVDCLQLREKELPDGELLRRARRLSGLCRERGVLFMVNDRPDLAVLSGADGVHLGQGDVGISDARRIMSTTAIVGVSTHTVQQVAQAAVQAPDYIAVGPMFTTATKPQDHLAGPATLSFAAQHTSLPLVAVGGISTVNAPELLSAAACCLCVCSAVISQPDVAAAVSRLRRTVDQSDTQPAA